jgi:hypothetical protein
MSGNAAPAFLDENGDGIADELRFIEVRCGLIFQAITNIRVDEGSFYAKFKIFNEWHVQAEGLYATQLSRASTNSAVGKHHLNAGIDKLFPPTYLLNGLEYACFDTNMMVSFGQELSYANGCAPDLSQERRQEKEFTVLEVRSMRGTFQSNFNMRDFPVAAQTLLVVMQFGGQAGSGMPIHHLVMKKYGDQETAVLFGPYFSLSEWAVFRPRTAVRLLTYEGRVANDKELHTGEKRCVGTSTFTCYIIVERAHQRNMFTMVFQVMLTATFATSNFFLSLSTYLSVWA